MRPGTLGLTTLTLALIASAPAATRGGDPAGAARFQVPEGFVVGKVASRPLVRYPLFACFDDRGRLFVAEGTGTNLPGEPRFTGRTRSAC